MKKIIIILVLLGLLSQIGFVLAAPPGGQGAICCGSTDENDVQRKDFPQSTCLPGLVCHCLAESDCEVIQEGDEWVFKDGKRGGICAPKDAEVVCPFGPWSITEIIDSITKWIFYFAVIGCPLMIVIGAFIFLTSAGDPNKITRGKKLILWSSIGLAVILFSRAILGIIKAIIGV